jgi:hypothetical protein
MIRVAKGGCETNMVRKVCIIPPGKRVHPEHLEKAKNSKKGGYTDDEIDKPAEFCSGAHCVDDEVVNAYIVEEKDEGPNAGVAVQREDSRE